MAELITTITEVPVEDVIVRDRLRPVSEAGVAALLASIGELGVIKDAIHVRRKKDGSLHLMAGAHRLTAARQLGWATIPAKVWTCTDDWARLMEIDDNLAGSELTVLDTAVFLARRKQVYERMHPQTKAATGAELAAKRWNPDASDIVSFASATAEKFGISKRHVERLVTIGHRLGVDEVGMLRRAPRPVALKDLMVMAKIADPVERHDVVRMLSLGNAKSAENARAILRSNGDVAQAPKDPVEGGFKALRDAWARASKADRKKFLTVEGKVIFDLLREIREGEAEA